MIHPQRTLIHKKRWRHSLQGLPTSLSVQSFKWLAALVKLPRFEMWVHPLKDSPPTETVIVTLYFRVYALWGFQRRTRVALNVIYLVSPSKFMLEGVIAWTDFYVGFGWWGGVCHCDVIHLREMCVGYYELPPQPGYSFWQLCLVSLKYMYLGVAAWSSWLTNLTGSHSLSSWQSRLVCVVLSYLKLQCWPQWT